MAIDTAAKRRNVNRMVTSFLVLGLSPTLGVDTNDRENSAGSYIGFDYAAALPVSNAYRIKIRRTVGPGLT